MSHQRFNGLKIGNNERIPVKAQHVLYLTLQNFPLSFFSSSLVSFDFQWGKKVSTGCSALQDPCSINTPRPEEAWEPVSLKSVTMWTIRTKTAGRWSDISGERFVRCNQHESCLYPEEQMSHRVQMCYILKCGTELQWIRTWAVSRLLKNEEFQSCPHDT